MGKLGQALGYDMDLGSEPEDTEVSEPEPASVTEPKKGAVSAETMAMKMFEKASTTEAKVTALKAFLEACGAVGSDY